MQNMIIFFLISNRILKALFGFFASGIQATTNKRLSKYPNGCKTKKNRF